MSSESKTNELTMKVVRGAKLEFPLGLHSPARMSEEIPQSQALFSLPSLHVSVRKIIKFPLCNSLI